MLVVSAAGGPGGPAHPTTGTALRAARRGPLFDPMREFSSTAASTPRTARFSYSYLASETLTAFMQFPALSRT